MIQNPIRLGYCGGVYFITKFLGRGKLYGSADGVCRKGCEGCATHRRSPASVHVPAACTTFFKQRITLINY
jgi:hypothetical protein